MPIRADKGYSRREMEHNLDKLSLFVPQDTYTGDDWGSALIALMRAIRHQLEDLEDRIEKIEEKQQR